MTQDNDYEVLVAVHKVTEWRDGCVFRTEYVGERWVPMGTRGKTVDDEFFGALSTKRSRELDDQGIMTIRRKR